MLHHLRLPCDLAEAILAWEEYVSSPLYLISVVPIWYLVDSIIPCTWYLLWSFASLLYFDPLLFICCKCKILLDINKVSVYIFALICAYKLRFIALKLRLKGCGCFPGLMKPNTWKNYLPASHQMSDFFSFWVISNIWQVKSFLTHRDSHFRERKLTDSSKSTPTVMDTHINKNTNESSSSPTFYNVNPIQQCYSMFVQDSRNEQTLWIICHRWNLMGIVMRIWWLWMYRCNPPKIKGILYL